LALPIIMHHFSPLYLIIIPTVEFDEYSSPCSCDKISYHLARAITKQIVSCRCQNSFVFLPQCKLRIPCWLSLQPCRLLVSASACVNQRQLSWTTQSYLRVKGVKASSLVLIHTSTVQHLAC